jgi:hypothetical protein
MHHVLDFFIVWESVSIFELSKNMVIRWGKIWTMCWVGEKLTFQFLNHFNGHCCGMRSSIVMIWNKSICHNSSAFTENSGFQLLKYSTILCTSDYLATILAVLKHGSFKVPKQCQHHLASRKHTSLLGCGWRHVFPLHALMFACRLIAVHLCSITCDNPLQENLSFFMIMLKKLHIHFNVCPFVLICKLLWHPPCLIFDTRGFCGWGNMQIHSWYPSCQLYQW